MKKILIIITIGCLAIHVYATDNNTLHVFNSGETISSTKVNHNFIITSNYVVKANGEIVGDFLGLNNNALTVMTDKNFLIQINSATGKIKGKMAYFEQNDCTGNRYVLENDALLGEVLNTYRENDTDGSNKLMYLARDETLLTSLTLYTFMAMDCRSYSGNFYRLQDNIEATTGISGDFNTPITISK